MRFLTHGGWAVILVAAIGLASCADSRAVRRQAEAVGDRLATAGESGLADHPGAATPADSSKIWGRYPYFLRRAGTARAKEIGVASPNFRLTLYLAPRDEGADQVAAAETPAKAPQEQAPAGEKAAKPEAPFASIEDKSFGEIFKSDLRAAPAALWRGTQHSFFNTSNLVILTLAFGADRLVRETLDGKVRDDFRRQDTSLAETGDFGSVIGNPTLHLGLAGAWYLYSVNRRDAKQHEFSKTMLEALTLNALATGLLKITMHDRAPNEELWGWPSGHMSSSICFAAVIQEYYGWQVALPFYMLAAYSGATRLEDREHDLSDLVFGAALGWVIGHSVVKGELPQLAGFNILPYGGAQGGGLMFMRRW